MTMHKAPDLDTIASMLAGGHSAEAIAERFGVARGTIYSIVSRAGTTVRELTPGWRMPRRVMPDDHELLRCVEEGLTIRQIAERHDVCLTTARVYFSARWEGPRPSRKPQFRHKQAA